MTDIEEQEHNTLVSILCQVDKIIYSDGDRRKYKFRIRLPGDHQYTVIIWDGSPAADINYESGNWYEFENILVKQWADGAELNATSKTKAVPVDSRPEVISRDTDRDSESYDPRSECSTGHSKKSSSDDSDIVGTLNWLQEESTHSEQLKFSKTIPEQPPEQASVDLRPEVDTALNELGIEQLYDHQARALKAARNGQHIVLASDTASGKSLPYRILAAERALRENGTTLYIAPMRSLINDQAEGFETFVDALDTPRQVETAVYSGETPQKRRRAIRNEQPRVLLMTPELVHQSLLPWNEVHWRWFFRQLNTIVIDEVHHFRGIFGSHLGLVLRRLNRMANEYDSDPQYFCCSATIGNPKSHVSNITNQPSNMFVAIDEDTSSRGKRHWLFYNPRFKTQSASEGGPSAEYPDNWPSIRKSVLARDNYTCMNCGLRGGAYSPVDFDVHHIIPRGRGGTHHKSNLIALCRNCHSQQPGHESTGGPATNASTPQEVIQEVERKSHRPVALQLFVELVDRGHQTLVFTNTRQEAERYAIAASDKFQSFGRTELADDIQPYHAGLPSAKRKAIEDQLQSGEIRGAWTTNALELGVDVGGLDAVILSGHPGTTMSLFQRAGRAGRGRGDCLILFVASSNPLDQYSMTNPEEVFEDNPGDAATNPTNEQILTDHLLSAANEKPLTLSDKKYFGDDYQQHIVDLTQKNKLTRRTENDQPRWHCEKDGPQHDMDLRGIPDREMTLVDQARGIQIGSLSLRDAIQDCHPGAVYLQQKQRYRVESFDADNDEVYLTEYDGNEFTQALSDESISVTEHLDKRKPNNLRDITVGFCKVTYQSQVSEYLIMEGPQDENPVKEAIPQELPRFEFQTEALYIIVPSRFRHRALKMSNVEHPFLCGLHGIEHLLTSLFPLEILCEQDDIGGLSHTNHEFTNKGTIFIYDRIPGGVGLSKSGYDKIEQLLERAYSSIIECDCAYGCPSCIHSPRCRSGNRSLNKDLSTLMLEWMDVPKERQYI